MKEQHRVAAEKQKAKETVHEDAPLEAKYPEEEVGFVAVAAGEGVINLFKDLGCAVVISGGQTMNPSTEKITEAILATPAKTVYVFPNNKNIIMSAQQSVSLVKDRTVVIVPTKTIAQGASAILAYNPDLNSQENAELMAETASKVKTGQITFAARDTEFGGFKIKENDILALSDGKLLFTEKNPVDAAVNLAKKLRNKETEFITLIYGEDITSEQAEEVKNRMDKYLKSGAEITLVEGKKPIYHFIISVE